MQSRSPRLLRAWTTPSLNSRVLHIGIGLAPFSPTDSTPACQAHKGLIRRRPRGGRLRLDARIDERVDDRRAILWHAPRAQAPPQRLLLAHQLLRATLLGVDAGCWQRLLLASQNLYTSCCNNEAY